MSFFPKMNFTTYCVTAQLVVSPCFGRNLCYKLHVASFVQCVCASLISLLKLNALSVGVFLQFSCRFLYVHSRFSSRGVCLCAHYVCVCVCIFMDARLPAQIWRLVACSFEGWRNLRGRLKYCAVIGIALSSVSSINVQFSI